MIEVLKELKHLREQEEELTNQYKSLKEQFEKDNQNLINKRNGLKHEIIQTTNIIKEKAVKLFHKTGEKKFENGNVFIKEFTQLNYEDEYALDWAKEHDMCLQLNKKAFESIAKTGEIEFVETTKIGKANIKSKIVV